MAKFHVRAGDSIYPDHDEQRKKHPYKVTKVEPCGDPETQEGKLMITAEAAKLGDNEGTQEFHSVAYDGIIRVDSDGVHRPITDPRPT